MMVMYVHILLDRITVPLNIVVVLVFASDCAPGASLVDRVAVADDSSSLL